MISVHQAEQYIFSQLLLTATCDCSLDTAIGKVLAETIDADRDFPPFNRVAMDGFAIKFEVWESGQRQFPYQETQKAGDPQSSLQNPKMCIKVSTGASLPEGTNCVIPVEHTVTEQDHMEVLDTVRLKAHQNIHAKGSDYEKGARLVQKGKKITAADIGVFATVGKSKVKVVSHPKVAVISTGNELVPIESKPKEYQIRSSNSAVIQSTLASFGVSRPKYIHLKDDLSSIEKGIESCLSDHDVLILSGGVSAGQFDFVPDALKKNGVKEVFHKVKQRPGKPMWFGRKGDKAVFGLPGNPVSVTICLYRYIVPFLLKSLGQEAPFFETARLGAEISFQKPLTLFKPANIKNQEGEQIVTPIKMNGSGDLASLSQANGFIECEESDSFLEKGTIVKVYRWTN